MLCALTLPLAATAGAESGSHEIAPPGPCAEPRETSVFAPPSGPKIASKDNPEVDFSLRPDGIPRGGFPTGPGLTGQTGGSETFSVVGPLPDLFDPTADVAAGPGDGLLTFQDPPLAARSFTSPGSCESGTGCGLQPPIGPGNPPIIAGGRPTPGSGTPTQ